ncbi:MAG: magnesium transporter [Methanomassiliicoccales archaeon]|nr:MAG: magnesium transporter [Methanomassiliicoccales archaeon]
MKVSAVLKQSLPLLLLCGIGEVAAGALFGHSADTLDLLPGLIVLVPALIGLRGNINTTLGSRLGSAAHMGLISSKNFLNDEMKENFKASIMLSVAMSFLAGLLAYLTSIAVGKSSVSMLIIIAIAVLAGSIAGIILAFITMGIILFAFKRGLDPDNVTGPSLATVGDLITLACIFGVAILIGGI